MAIRPTCRPTVKPSRTRADKATGQGDRFLERLKATRGDVPAQAVVMADFLLSTRPEDERLQLREALDAASVLHWFDPELLRRVLDVTVEDAQGRYEKLISLKFAEVSGLGGALKRHNIHEATRLGWRRLMADEAPERFRELSSRAAAFFSEDLNASSRIEWIYHLLCGDPEAGATALESLSREWSGSAGPEDEAALAFALEELEAGGLVAGRARAWSLLTIAWARDSRGETARLGDTAAEALSLAIETNDLPAEADAQCLAGAALQAQGQLEAAQTALGETLAISRRLAEQDPSNAGWQRDLAVANWWIAHLQMQAGRADDAMARYEEAARIFGELADQAPDVVQWVKDKKAVEAELVLCRLSIERTPPSRGIRSQRFHLP